MLGVPPSDEAQIFEWTNLINGIGDPEFGYSLEKLNSAIMEMYEYALAPGRDRRQNPRDDIASILMAAEVDGKRLTANEFANFFNLLAGAGNETTRHAISWGAKLLTDHPDQREELRNDYDDPARPPQVGGHGRTRSADVELPQRHRAPALLGCLNPDGSPGLLHPATTLPAQSAVVRWS